MEGESVNEQLICELNVALIPEAELARRLISLSKQMAGRYRSVIQLNGVTPRVAFAPHVTLYQVPVPVRALPGVRVALLDVVRDALPISLGPTEYRSNDDEGSFEIRYEAPSEVIEVQDATIAAVNPRRGQLLLERDPAGRPLSQRRDESGPAGDNIRRTGFDAVGDPARGGLFQPHITINWFEPGTSVDLKDPDLPSISDFEGRFVALGIFLLGPYGTCAQRLAALRYAA
jgi:hypothetical protein